MNVVFTISLFAICIPIGLFLIFGISYWMSEFISECATLWPLHYLWRLLFKSALYSEGWDKPKKEFPGLYKDQVNERFIFEQMAKYPQEYFKRLLMLGVFMGIWLTLICIFLIKLAQRIN